MKKLVILVLVIVAAVVIWKKVAQGGGDDALASFSQRLDAAEKTFVQAGRAAGMAGVDTTAEAGGALQAVIQVERELRELSQNSPSAEDKRRIAQLLDRAMDLKRRMG